MAKKSAVVEVAAAAVVSTPPIENSRANGKAKRAPVAAPPVGKGGAGCGRHRDQRQEAGGQESPGQAGGRGRPRRPPTATVRAMASLPGTRASKSRYSRACSTSASVPVCTSAPPPPRAYFTSSTRQSITSSTSSTPATVRPSGSPSTAKGGSRCATRRGASPSTPRSRAGWCCRRRPGSSSNPSRAASSSRAPTSRRAACTGWASP